LAGEVTGAAAAAAAVAMPVFFLPRRILPSHFSSVVKTPTDCKNDAAQKGFVSFSFLRRFVVSVDTCG
jgi:hypothetical protein